MRALAFFVALLVLLVSLSAEAKKKKGGKKGKTPAAKTKGKSADAAPAPEEESDEASSDEKAPPSKAPVASEEEESKPSAPPPSEDEPVVKRKSVKVVKAPEDSETSGNPSAFRFLVGGSGLFRTLGWTGSNGMLASYSLSPGPQASIGLEAFPAAFATDGFAANIGVFGHFNYGFGASSTTPPPDNTKLTTKYQDLLAGLKIRIPFGTFIPYVAGAYGNQKFYLQPDNIGRPNFNYSYMYLGAGARIMFTPAVDLDLGGAYLLVMNPGSGAGEIASAGLYPRANAYGGAFNVSLGFRVASAIGIRAGVDFRQFGVNTHWQMNDGGVAAAGAADRYIAAFAGLEMVFDGVGGGGGGEEPAPVKKPAKAKKAPAGEGQGEEEQPEVSTDKSKAEPEEQ